MAKVSSCLILLYLANLCLAARIHSKDQEWAGLYSQALVLRTANLHGGLRKVADLAAPWADALPCTEDIKNNCSCGNWERWTTGDNYAPVACVRNTLAALYTLAKYVESKGYHPVVSGGTLLGAQRCGSFIPWDYDADVHVFARTITEMERFQREFNEWNGGDQRPESLWVTFTSNWVQDWMPSGPSTVNGNVHIDFGVRTVDKIPDLVPVVLNDVILYGPANYKEELEKMYGPDALTVGKRWTKWESGQLGAPLKLDQLSVTGCEDRLKSIHEEIEKLKSTGSLA